MTRWLATTTPVAFNSYCILAAFSTYFCMYAFRKPFSVGLFAGSAGLAWFPALDYKIALIVAQVLGYTLSKFIGIKVVSELPARRRAMALVALIGIAELALLAFAVVPKPWNIVFLFLNGIPLGMVWGLVFGFLEGRRSTELLGAGLSVSYIVASGAVKTVGRWVLALGVTEMWMPFVVGVLFFVPFLLFVQMLRCLPPPTPEDEAQRVRREPMNGAQRRAFFLMFAPGLVALTGLYMLLTAYRDFRDNFAREIWDALGFGGMPEIFTLSEIPIAVVVMVALALVMKVRNNQRGVAIIHGIMLAGALLIGLSTLAFQAGICSPVAWMILVGLGLYLAYVPYGCVLFDRLIACVSVVATAGFMIYVTDAFGYLGSVLLLLYKNFGQPTLSWLDFFIWFSYTTSILCSAAFLFSLWYFRSSALARKNGQTSPSAASAAM